jgi:hypothetical protein
VPEQVLAPELVQALVPEPEQVLAPELAQVLEPEQVLAPELAQVLELVPALVQARSGGFSFSTHRAWLERPALHCARHCNRVPNGQQRMQGRLHHRSS